MKKYINNILEHLERLSVKKYILLLLGIGFVIRLFLVLKGYQSNVMAGFSDDNAYMNLALNMIQQGLFVTDLQQLGTYSSVVGPGMGIILYIPALIGGGSWIPVFILVAFGSALIPVFIFLAGREYFGIMTAYAASIWAMLYVPFYKNVASAGKDLWMTLGFIIFIWYFGRYLFDKKEITIKDILVSGVIYGFLILLDERFLVLSPVFFFFMVLNFSGPKTTVCVKQALLFAGVVILMLVPWTIRNYIVYERFILVSVRTAPVTEKLFGLSHIEYFPSSINAWYVSPEVIDSIQKGIKGPETETGEYLSPQQVDAMRQGIVPHKFSGGEYLLSNFIEFWQPMDIWYAYKQDGYRFDGKWSVMHNISILFSYGVLIPFFIWGVIKLYKVKRNHALLFISLILLYMVFHMVMVPFTEYRYRMPLDSILILLAFYSIVEKGFMGSQESEMTAGKIESGN